MQNVIWFPWYGQSNIYVTSVIFYQVITGYLLAGSIIGPGGFNFVSEMVQVRCSWSYHLWLFSGFFFPLPRNWKITITFGMLFWVHVHAPVCFILVFSAEKGTFRLCSSSEKIRCRVLYMFMRSSQMYSIINTPFKWWVTNQ